MINGCAGVRNIMNRVFSLIVILVLNIMVQGCVSTSLVQNMLDDISKLKKENQELKTSVTTLETDVNNLKVLTDAERKTEEKLIEPTTTPTHLNTPIAIETPKFENAEELYTKGLDAYHANNYPEAIKIFEESTILSDSPEMKSKCYYWMGECYYSLKSYEKAVEIFNRVYKDYNSEIKAPDALLKIGFTYCELQDYNKAVQVLKEFVTKYPTHRAIPLAKEKLLWLEEVTSKTGRADSARKQ
jgi:TolA-binding protein